MNETQIMIAFIRKHTRLKMLAHLLEQGAHLWSPTTLKAYCKQHEIILVWGDEER